MVNYVWMGLIIIGIIYAMIHGTMDAVTNAIFSSSKEAVGLTLGFISVFVFWLGMMRIAEKAGLLRAMTKMIEPLMAFIFPALPKGHRVHAYIMSNMVANMFGLGNAATPFGIRAMKEMKLLHPYDEASRSMITFLALNTSGLTIFPATVVAIRIKYGAIQPLEIIVTAIIATCFSTISALLFDRIFYLLEMKKNRTVK